MLTHIPALGSAFLGGVLLYLSIYLPIQSIIFAALLAGFGTMALAYSYGTLRTGASTSRERTKGRRHASTLHEVMRCR